MAVKWVVKELLTAIKMNNFGIRRMTAAEQQATVDAERLAGDNFFNTDKKTMEIYQSGSGSVFKVTELSNFVFRSGDRVGVGSVEKKVYDEEITNMKGISNTRIIVLLDYLPEVNQAGSVKVTVTDGVSPVTVTENFTSNPAPITIFKRFEINTSSFAIDDILNIQILGTQVNIDHVEIRSI